MVLLTIGFCIFILQKFIQRFEEEATERTESLLRILEQEMYYGFDDEG
jgi:hypothetical protein